MSLILFFRFNDRAFAVDQTNPAFPRSTAYWWFGCKDAPEGTIGTSGSKGWLLDGESKSEPKWQDANQYNETGRKNILEKSNRVFCIRQSNNLYEQKLV